MTNLHLGIKTTNRDLTEGFRNTMYFTMRVLLISISIGSVTAAYFLNDDYAAIENMRLTSENLGWLILYPLFAALVTWAVITLQSRLSGLPVIWPLWNSNPFNFKQPATYDWVGLHRFWADRSDSWLDSVWNIQQDRRDSTFSGYWCGDGDQICS